jgi:DTW domain-containing protein YfiP
MTTPAPLLDQARASHEPRAVCARCRRPEIVCYCRHLSSLDTRTRVVLLQHPRERDVPIGTAHMASLCLPNSELHVGVRWGGSSALARALSDPARPAVLLYPGPGAIDVVRDPPRGPVTLVVVDGTWWQAKKVVRENPELAALPRYAFTPPSPSEYRIRREPHEAYVSTIEALVHVLGALEGDPAKFEALLAPFRAMVEGQLEYAKTVRGARVRHAKLTPKPRRLPRVPAALRDREHDVVCVVGEANAWPYRCAERATSAPDELVHWVAHRLGTGETFEMVVRAEHILAPRTPSYVGLSEATLARGATRAELSAKWRAFVRDTDVVCSWGRYATSLFAGTGAYLPVERIDLRQVARVFSRGKVGTLDEFVDRIATTTARGTTPLSPTLTEVPGRAGMRLAQITGVAKHLGAAARGETQ